MSPGTPRERVYEALATETNDERTGQVTPRHRFRNPPTRTWRPNSQPDTDGRCRGRLALPIGGAVPHC
jgi:hypothetical protein